MALNKLTDQLELLQNLLISRATGGGGDNSEYVRLRQLVLSNKTLESLSPDFLRTCRDVSQFWQHIKYKHERYEGRRDYIWAELRPLFDAAEKATLAPSDEMVSLKLGKFDADHVQTAWSKALDRRSSDPEGAITSARTLIEAVCKHILDGSGISYDDSADLPKLYKLTAESLSLAPSQHTEQVFKQILGGCTAVVEGLGSLRNRLSDAHGKGRIGIKPAPRHAELTVNLSGALATYLLATWEASIETPI